MDSSFLYTHVWCAMGSREQALPSSLSSTVQHIYTRETYIGFLNGYKTEQRLKWTNRYSKVAPCMQQDYSALTLHSEEEAIAC